jgi:Fe-S cluster biogenesis protein NfuA
MTEEIGIKGEPITDAMCRFTVDRPVYPNKSLHFGTKEHAEDSELASAIFAIEGVRAVQVSHDQVTVRKTGMDDWMVVGKQVGAAIRSFIATEKPAVNDQLKHEIPSPEVIRENVQRVLDTEINPSVAQHGGMIKLIDVKENVVYIQMGGGCQGCGQADVTLKFGIEAAIREAVPGVGDILDVTDHASGRNPYYTPSAK